jgi:integrase
MAEASKKRLLPQKRNRKGCGSLFQKTKGGVWHAQFYRPNPDTGVSERVRECLWTKDRAEAQKKLNERQVQVGRGELFEVGKRKTVTDLYKALLSDTKRHNPRPRASKGLEWRWKHLQPLFGHVFAASVTTKRIDDYKDKRIEEGAAKATVNRELATLRRAFNFGRQQTPPLVFSVPPIRLFSEKGNEREGFVELADYDGLVAEATRAEVLEAEGPWLRALLECGFSYGWRKGELVGLRARQLNFTAREIRLPPVSTKSKSPAWFT